jgi:FixJ family two-component response regulator
MAKGTRGRKHLPTVFVVEDEDSVREAVDSLPCSAGLRVKLFSTARERLAELFPGDYGCLILDVRLPRVSGRVPHKNHERQKLKQVALFGTGAIFTVIGPSSRQRCALCPAAFWSRL